jgi:hypothetical protein
MASVMTFTSLSEIQKQRLREKAAVKKAERSALPQSHRPPRTPNFSGTSRRSWKKDDFGFDIAEKV